VKKITRRNFNKLLGAFSAVSALEAVAGYPTPLLAAKQQVVVIGGGFGGATAAKYLRLMDSNLQVTLVEPKRYYYTCPFSNLVLGGYKDLSEIRYGYDNLSRYYGIHVIQATAARLNASSKKVILTDGKSFSYNRAIVSPGVDMRFDKMEGYNYGIVNKIPHAWKAGRSTLLLKKQLVEMRDGGTVLICPPDQPYRCPPGPYERAGLIAHFLKQHKPRSKILILDAKEQFAKQALFTSGWEQLYGHMIEWFPGSAGGKILRVDAGEMAVETEFGIEEGDVINFIPDQWAGQIAHESGLVDESGWCPVDQRTFESTIHPGIHIIGDAAIAGAMPKSGLSASSQAKFTAVAVIDMLNNKNPETTSLANTCYSFLAPEYAISVASVYHLSGSKIVKAEGSGGVSPINANLSVRRAEAIYAQGWYDSITQDMFG
jgi:sulfide dehydrogenase [flavocytochrome c] flavoprotein subunit